MLFCESPNAYSSLAMYSHAALTASFTATRVMSSVACAPSPRPRACERGGDEGVEVVVDVVVSPPPPHTALTHGLGHGGDTDEQRVGEERGERGVIPAVSALTRT